MIAKDGSLITYGNMAAKEQLMQSVRQWVELGMPDAANFDLKIYSRDYPLTTGQNDWIVKHKESQFLWHLTI